MATSALIGSTVCGGSLIFGVTGDESGPGQARGRWAVMEADIWGPRQPEPSLSPSEATRPLWWLALAWPAWRAVQMGSNWLERPR